MIYPWLHEPFGSIPVPAAEDIPEAVWKPAGQQDTVASHSVCPRFEPNDGVCFMS